MVRVNVQQKSAHSGTFRASFHFQAPPTLGSGASAAVANVCKLSLGVFSYQAPALSTSAKGDFSVSLPSISFRAIVERSAPLRKAGPELVSGRPWTD